MKTVDEMIKQLENALKNHQQDGLTQTAYDLAEHMTNRTLSPEEIQHFRAHTTQLFNKNTRPSERSYIQCLLDTITSYEKALAPIIEVQSLAHHVRGRYFWKVRLRTIAKQKTYRRAPCSPLFLEWAERHDLIEVHEATITITPKGEQVNRLLLGP